MSTFATSRGASPRSSTSRWSKNRNKNSRSQSQRGCDAASIASAPPTFPSNLEGRISKSSSSIVGYPTNANANANANTNANASTKQSLPQLPPPSSRSVNLRAAHSTLSSLTVLKLKEEQEKDEDEDRDDRDNHHPQQQQQQQQQQRRRRNSNTRRQNYSSSTTPPQQQQQQKQQQRPPKPKLKRPPTAQQQTRQRPRGRGRRRETDAETDMERPEQLAASATPNRISTLDGAIDMTMKNKKKDVHSHPSSSSTSGHSNRRPSKSAFASIPLVNSTQMPTTATATATATANSQATSPATFPATSPAISPATPTTTVPMRTSSSRTKPTSSISCRRYSPESSRHPKHTSTPQYDTSDTTTVTSASIDINDNHRYDHGNSTNDDDHHDHNDEMTISTLGLSSVGASGRSQPQVIVLNRKRPAFVGHSKSSKRTEGHSTPTIISTIQNYQTQLPNDDDDDNQRAINPAAMGMVPTITILRASLYSEYTNNPSWRIGRRRKYFHKWGVPMAPLTRRRSQSSLLLERDNASAASSHHHHQSLDAILQERLVWIRYKDKYWWPVILYDNYRQLVDDPALSKHVWNRLPVWKRMEIAAMLVFQPNSSRQDVLVGRLLGTTPNASMRLMEMEEFWPFSATQVTAAISLQACHGDYFWQHPSLYLEWHRAMDDVELILAECLCDDTMVLPMTTTKTTKEVSENPSSSSLSSPPTALLDDDMATLGENTIAAIPRQQGKKVTWLERAKQAERTEWASTYQECHSIFATASCFSSGRCGRTATGTAETNETTGVAMAADATTLTATIPTTQSKLTEWARLLSP